MRGREVRTHRKYRSRNIDMWNRRQIGVGALAGLFGGIWIWLYEAIVWVGVQHLMPLQDIARNATGLVFGKQVQKSLGGLSYILGIAIHFTFAIAWGVIFAAIWPSLRRRGIEATLAALAYAILIWIVMHVAISIASNNHPDYLDPATVIGGFMSHFFYTVPLALLVKSKFAGSN